MKKLKRIGFIFLFLILVVTISPASAQAPNTLETQNPIPTTGSTTSVSTSGVSQTKTNNLDTLYGNVNPQVSRNLTTLAQTTTISVLASTICFLSGIDPLNPADGKCLGVNMKTGQIGYAKQNTGAAQIMGNLIGGTFSLPISSAGYAQYAMSNFGITKSAYAQNTTSLGYNRLSPLIGVWTKFRDIAYLLFVLAFTVIGLAIMFRVKIDARTVMTIQNQIPKIIIALVLVTMSYAIAGFLIDVMYVIMYLFILAFNSITPVHISTTTNVFSVANSAFQVSGPAGLKDAATNSFGGVGALAYSVGTSGIFNLTLEVSRTIGGVFSSMTTDFLSSTISSLFKIPFMPFSAIDAGCELMSGLKTFTSWTTPLGLVGHIPKVGDTLQGTPLVGGLVFGGGPDCNFVESFFEGTITFIFGALAFLIILIAILYTLFKVWFMLVKSFCYVLVDAMIAPLWITAGIFPGSKLGFSSWFRHLAGHLSVFPMTFAVILLGKTMMDSVSQSSDALFSPPLIGGAISGNSSVAALIGFGFILTMPSILERTKKAVGALDFGLKDIQGSIVGAGIGTYGRANKEYSDVRRESRTKEPDDTGAWKPTGLGTALRRRLPFGPNK